MLISLHLELKQILFSLKFLYTQEEIQIVERETVREEVIEELIEYEYEVVDNHRRLVGEKNLGRTVTVQVNLDAKLLV